MAKQIDELTLARRRKRRKYRIRRFIAVISLIAVVIPIVILVDKVNIYTFKSIGDFFETTFAANKGYPAMLNSSKPLDALELKGATALLTSSELIVKGTRGAELFRHTHGYSNPLIDVGKTRIIIYDSGNKGYSIYNRTGQLFSSDSEYPIVSSSIAGNGMAAILTRGERSLSELEILSSTNYLTYFTWYGVSGFPLYCNFSNDSSEVYVVTLNVTNSEVVSIITFIDMDKREEKAAITLSGVVLKVYDDDTGYTVVTDTGAFRINGEYMLENRYMFSKTPILGISKKDNYLAIAFGDNNRVDVNNIVILGDKLEQQVKLTNVGSVDYIYMTSNYLYLLSSGRIYGITPSGEYSLSGEMVSRANSIFMIGNKVYVLLNDRIEPLELEEIAKVSP